MKNTSVTATPPMPSGNVKGVKPPPGPGGGCDNDNKRAKGDTKDENDNKDVYKDEHEYDEDLAQLDMLLHYVNNLSASLEFLAWENKRISTDLVPTLLTMYDALYARLNEGGDAPASSTPHDGDEGGGGGGGGGGTEEEEKKKGLTKGYSNGNVDLSKVGLEKCTKESGISDGAKENGVCQLFIEEKEVENENLVNNNTGSYKCESCGSFRATTKDACRCGAKCSIAESLTHMFEDIERDLDTPTYFYDNVDNSSVSSTGNSNSLSGTNSSGIGTSVSATSNGTGPRRPQKEHIYEEPQFLIKPKDSPKSISSNTSSSTTCSSSSAATLTSTSTTTSSSTPTSPPMGFDPRKLKDVYRPLSSISSSSSSSSSSNSLPRVLPSVATAYLASAESLEDNDADHSDTEDQTTRRRDRTIKTRREKAQRTGSGDSGVQCHSISLPAPPALRPRYCDPNLAYMDRIVLEIVETEAVYVRDLREIIQGYLEHWRRQPESGVTQRQVDDLFSNIEQIYAFNRGFLAELEECGVDPVEVARCFVRNNNGFAIYTQYCTNYPRTVSVLTELMRGEASVRAFRERQLALGHTLPLGSYLLKPVQRILKYHLLLGNIVKHFEKECSGYAEIWNALSAMTGMAHHINDMKRRHEHAVRVQEIQSLLYGWQFEDLTTYGELAAEGTFRMWGAKGLRHVFLFDKMLLVAKKKEENILMYKTHILCSNLMLIESVPGEPLSFHVIPFDNPRMQHTLEARSLEQKREWTLQLKRVILENYSANIPAHARQLVMELGQSKPDDVVMSEGRSSGRRVHQAPEYLEKRKVDRERRRSSEGGLNTKLRLRRSSRTRKEKDEANQQKVSRSRSVSRTRDTEDEEMERKISSTSVPSTTEKPKLKLSMWGRRRSEPGIGSRESLSLSATINLDESPSTPPTPLRPPSQDLSTPTTPGPPTPDVSLDRVSISEYELEEAEVVRPDEECSENGENLEEIISQLLQNKLQLQKLLLSKQRRNMLRKKLPLRYETSDTENEDGPLKLNGSYAGSEVGDTLRPEEVGDYVDFYFNGLNKETESATQIESANVSSSECQSLYSSAVSVHQTCDTSSLSREKKCKPVRRSSSDLSFKKMPTLKKINSNYDNLLNIWSTIRGKSPEKRQSGIFQQTKLSLTPTATLERPRLRRAQSFSAEKCLSSNQEHMYVSAANLTPQPSTAPAESKPADVWVRDDLRESSKDPRERPVTIAFYNSNEVSLSALEQYLNQPRAPGRGNERFPYDTEDNMTDYSMTPHMSMDNILSIHPEHKIYKSTNNKTTLRNVLSKITSPRNNKTVSEPSGSVYNYSIESDVDKGVDKKASKMVYNMARQCSRTLKERIKQIRAEDVEKSPPAKTPTENPYSIPMYKQGSSSIGARLAGTNEPSDYAVPRIKPLEQKVKCEPRPDSVLSSSSILTSSSSSSSASSRDTKLLEGVEVSHSMANVEEENEEVHESPSFDSDASADSYYERSFEAIENLETEIFRDSAIYSDPEETESPPSSLNQDKSTSPRSKSLSPKKYSLRSSTKSTRSATSPTPNKSPEIVVTPEDSLQTMTDEMSPCNESFPESPRSSPQPKKVPPPVPAKPDSIKTKRLCGNLIMQQLKNLEECTKFSREDQNSPSFDGIRTLDDRRKELEVCRVRDEDSLGSERDDGADRSSRSPRSPALLTPSTIIKSPITLSPLNATNLPATRSSSVPPRLSPRPSVTPDSPQPASTGPHSPVGSERSSPLPSCASPINPDMDDFDEPRVARGWVRHVIGKLQAETDV